MPTKDGKKEIAKETKRFRNEIDLFGKVNTEVILIDKKNVIRLKNHSIFIEMRISSVWSLYKVSVATC